MVRGENVREEGAGKVCQGVQVSGQGWDKTLEDGFQADQARSG